MIYGYIRVSTDKQTVENQRFEIKRYCEYQNWTIDKWIAEIISGTKEVNKRKLAPLIASMEPGDMLLCSEISRLERSMFMILDLLKVCLKKGIRVRTIKENYTFVCFQRKNRLLLLIYSGILFFSINRTNFAARTTNYH